MPLPGQPTISIGSASRPSVVSMNSGKPIQTPSWPTRSSRLAKRYGFSSWRALKAHVDSLTIDGQLFEAARDGNQPRLVALLDEHPEKLHARSKPYEWTLLHAAASGGHLAAVDLLLTRGLDVNTREKGDNTYAMHWAAAAGHLDVVRRLADAGGDVVGHGDDHRAGGDRLGHVLGWTATTARIARSRTFW